MSVERILINPDAAAVAGAAAARLITAILDAQSATGTASVVLTGGGTGIGTLQAVAASTAAASVNWSAVDFWWGDERFIAATDSERNDVQAHDALLSNVEVDPARVHRMPAADGQFGDDPDAAAFWYAEQLAAAAANGRSPRFDVVMLGLGEEGHTASIFPHSAAATDPRSVCAVRNCPKPPPTRLTMTFEVLSHATDVWMLTAGKAKSEAIARAASGANREELPCAGPKGIEQTLWMIDVAAATLLGQRN
ncbi:MAG: 6-phosphogluconolactonase [Antricoccus sp.]